MPANARQIERYWTEPPDDEPMVPCPWCGGVGVYYGHIGDETYCSRCHGTGFVPVEPNEDRDYDAMVDREMEAGR